MEVVHDQVGLEAALAGLRGRRRIGFVPTMGALHPGHLSLLAHARAEGAEVLVCSIFVNPSQFGPHEDFGSYPRTFAADHDALLAAGTDVLFAPSVDVIYPPQFSTFLEPTGPAIGFEGEVRPGHFRGVATVVARLFGLVRPDLAVFGEKDAQQLVVVRRLVADLGLPIEVIGAPIAREPDGLAMSSRNRYLDPAQRRAAAAIPRALARAKDLVAGGERQSSQLVAAVRRELETESLLGPIDYVAVVDGDSFTASERLTHGSYLVLAVRVGTTRLLDNFRLNLET